MRLAPNNALSMSANPAVQEGLLHYLDALQAA